MLHQKRYLNCYCDIAQIKYGLGVWRPKISDTIGDVLRMPSKACSEETAHMHIRIVVNATGGRDVKDLVSLHGTLGRK